jgi:hypothetical protein
MDVNDRNYYRCRGPCTATGCGGFASEASCYFVVQTHLIHSLQSTRTWDMQTSCLCSTVLMSHALLLEYAPVSISCGIAHPYLFSSPSLPAQPGIVSPPPPRAPVHGSSAPAMDGFGGVPPPSCGTMAAQRTSSAARTLIRGPFAVGNHTGPRGQYPNATSFNTQDLMVVLWPMVVRPYLWLCHHCPLIPPSA